MAPFIFIVRHGEKPAKGTKAVEPQGTKSGDSLIVRGWQRAGALAQIFRSGDPKLAFPTALFACYKSDHAQRALETITPLAEVLKLKVNTEVKKGKEAKMAKTAMACDGAVLIAWEHDAIHLIANEIMGDTTSVPQTWPDDRFDMIYVFTLVGNKYEFSQVPQMALVGDSSVPFAY